MWEGKVFYLFVRDGVQIEDINACGRYGWEVFQTQPILLIPSSEIGRHHLIEPPAHGSMVFRKLRPVLTVSNQMTEIPVGDE